MHTLIRVGGIFLLVAAGLQAWTVVSARKRGAPWHGVALMAAASLLYGVVTLSGIFIPATTVGVILTFVVAGLIWAGVIVTRRERSAAAIGQSN